MTVRPTISAKLDASIFVKKDTHQRPTIIAVEPIKIAPTSSKLETFDFAKLYQLGLNGITLENLTQLNLTAENAELLQIEYTSIRANRNLLAGQNFNGLKLDILAKTAALLEIRIGRKYTGKMGGYNTHKGK